MEQKNRSHGKIDNLPPELKKDVENRLLAGDTYEEVSEWLKRRGRRSTFPVSDGIGRKFLTSLRASGVAKEFAKLLAEDNVDRPATELHEANNLLASQIIMEALVDDSMDAKQRTEAAKSIASLQRAQVSNEKLKIEARKEQGAVHVAMDLLKEKVFSEIGQNYPEIAAKLLELAENTEKELTRMQ